jgi:hypothetical protein
MLACIGGAEHRALAEAILEQSARQATERSPHGS